MKFIALKSNYLHFKNLPLLTNSFWFFSQVFYRHLSFNIFLPDPWGKGDLGIWSKNNLQPILWWNREKLWAANSLENCILNTEKHKGFDTVRVQNNKENSQGITSLGTKYDPLLYSQLPFPFQHGCDMGWLYCSVSLDLAVFLHSCWTWLPSMFLALAAFPEWSHVH